jgi:cell wall-associated NlpC family hydrolase
LVQQQQQQQLQAEEQAAQTRIAAATALASLSPGYNTAAPPPTSSGGVGAVQAAESQLGVPYVWGGESPRGSADPGFDCSGLTAWSWGQVGVGLPHYSGAQMSDSTPVPLSDLEPGDLLFYGAGGSEHVAMYVSAGTMIEAPETGQSVHLTGLRLGDGFVGAGRP